MKILALIGSPRRRGNTDLLVDAALGEAEKHGHTGEKLYLYDYSIRPCVDCRACKQGEKICVQKDDMPKLYKAIDAAGARSVRATWLIPFRLLLDGWTTRSVAPTCLMRPP